MPITFFNIEVMAYIDSIANIRIQQPVTVNNESRSNRNASPIFCPDKIQAAHMMKAIQQAKDAGDSVGGIVAFTTQGLPVGLGDPVYEKLEANLAKAMLSIPASRILDRRRLRIQHASRLKSIMMNFQLITKETSPSPVTVLAVY